MIRASGAGARAPVRSLPALLLILLAVAPAAGQRADFLFGRPHVTLSVSTGWAMPGEGSDLFSETQRLLTVSPGDFGSYLFMVEGALRVTEQVDVALGLEHVGATVGSQMRGGWETDDFRPVSQATEFDRTRLMASARWYLFPRGRSLAEYVWVPNAWSPYIGGGLGVAWYDFRQYGDFVDYQTIYCQPGSVLQPECVADIIPARLRSEGSGFTQHVLAGADVSLSSHFLLRGEYRYIWGSAPVDQAVFEGFGDIDLSGSRVTLGIAVRM